MLIDEDVQFAADGTGPLLQRDYWAVIQGCRVEPKEVVEFIRSRFHQLAPEGLVRFANDSHPDGPLCVGDSMTVRIRMARKCRVLVTDINDLSMTIVTVNGHPESGKITFGSYRNDRGDVIFHIRSRVRSSSIWHLAGFLSVGDSMQTNTWTDFIDRLANCVGCGIVGPIHADKKKVDEEAADADPYAPTFIAKR